MNEQEFDWQQPENGLVEAHRQELRARLGAIQDFPSAGLAEFGLVLALGSLIGVAALALFNKLADEVMEQETLGFDTASVSWLNRFRSPASDMLMLGVSPMGAQVPGVVVAVVVAVLVGRRRWANAVSLLHVVGWCTAAQHLLKATFQRERPVPYL